MPNELTQTKIALSLLRVDWTRDLPLILSCSLFTAPYRWLYDHVVLSITQTLAIALALERQSSFALQTRTCMDWAVFQLLGAGLSFSFDHPVAQFFWFPLAVYFLWRKSLPRLGDTQTVVPSSLRGGFVTKNADCRRRRYKRSDKNAYGTHCYEMSVGSRFLVPRQNSLNWRECLAYS